MHAAKESAPDGSGQQSNWISAQIDTTPFEALKTNGKKAHAAVVQANSCSINPIAWSAIRTVSYSDDAN
uniref:Lipoprotein n=1 Tax=Ascaris lumbricoides TaxID=6252 RepID=A0A0M3HMA7_ASCLU